LYPVLAAFVAVIVVAPAANKVATPLVEFTVAIAVSLLA
jgi:hypothetical protein